MVQYAGRNFHEFPNRPRSTTGVGMDDLDLVL